MTHGKTDVRTDAMSTYQHRHPNQGYVAPSYGTSQSSFSDHHDPNDKDRSARNNSSHSIHTPLMIILAIGIVVIGALTITTLVLVSGTKNKVDSLASSASQDANGVESASLTNTIYYIGSSGGDNTGTDSSNICNKRGCYFDAPALPAKWNGWGGDLYNSRNQQLEFMLNTESVKHLREVWKIEIATAGVSASPTTIGDDYLYYPDWAGKVSAVGRKNGTVFWQFDVAAFLVPALLLQPPITNPIVAAVSRTSPYISGDFVYIGTHKGAYAIKLNRFTGALVWSIRLESNQHAIVTASPTVYGDVAIYGVSSLEEAHPYVAPEKCCSFRGSVVAVSISTGSIVWKTVMIPEGSSGAAVWGSMPSIDPVNNQVLVASGNAYSYSGEVEACRLANTNYSEPFKHDPCRQEGDYGNAIVALDVTSGSVNWAMTLGPIESWNLACGAPTMGVPSRPEGCPEHPSEDVDFGQAPIFVPGGSTTPRGVDSAFVAQKSGIVWAVSTQAGKVHWAKQTGPYSEEGGMVFGSASDGVGIYFLNNNGFRMNHTLRNGSVTTFPFLGKRDLKSGALVWDTPVHVGEKATRAVAVANGVVYSSAGTKFYALDAASGEILFQKQIGASAAHLGGSPTIVDGMVYVGYGERAGGGGLIAFGL